MGEDFKKCSKCKTTSLKSDFHKNTKSKNGLQSYCITCKKDYGKKYNLENQDRIKRYFSENRSKISALEKFFLNNRYKTDIKFRLKKKTRNRIYQSLKGMVKSSSTKDILGIDIETYKRWIEWQTTPDMTSENSEIDHVRPIPSFNISDDEQLKEAFTWRNTQPSLKGIH